MSKYMACFLAQAGIFRNVATIYSKCQLSKAPVGAIIGFTQSWLQRKEKGEATEIRKLLHKINCIFLVNRKKNLRYTIAVLKFCLNIGNTSWFPCSRPARGSIPSPVITWVGLQPRTDFQPSKMAKDFLRSKWISPPKLVFLRRIHRKSSNLM